MNTQTLTSEHILLSFLDLTAMLRAVNGISALPNKVLTTTPARRVFSNSVCREVRLMFVGSGDLLTHM